MAVIYYTECGETFRGKPGMTTDQMTEHLEEQGYKIEEIGGDFGR